MLLESRLCVVYWWIQSHEIKYFRPHDRYNWIIYTSGWLNATNVHEWLGCVFNYYTWDCKSWTEGISVNSKFWCSLHSGRISQRKSKEFHSILNQSDGDIFALALMLIRRVPDEQTMDEILKHLLQLTDDKEDSMCFFSNEQHRYHLFVCACMTCFNWLLFDSLALGIYNRFVCPTSVLV